MDQAPGTKRRCSHSAHSPVRGTNVQMDYHGKTRMVLKWGEVLWRPRKEVMFSLLENKVSFSKCSVRKQPPDR